MRSALRFCYVVLMICVMNLVAAEKVDSAGCSAGTTPESEEIKVLIPKLREAGNISSDVKDDLLVRYEEARERDESIINGTHPICIALSEYDDELADYERENSSLSQEISNYDGQCSGTLPEEQYNSCISWRANLTDRLSQLADWKARLDQKLESLNRQVNEINEQNNEFDVRLLSDIKNALNSPVEILVKRTSRPSGGGCTKGELWVNGEFFCYTLELPFRNNINNFSSIGVGTYDAGLRSTPGKPNGVIQLRNVQSVIYYNDGGNWRMGRIDRNAGSPVEIHSGNETKDTRGCILVGDTFTDECRILDSRVALRRLYKTYFGSDDTPDQNRKITVTITTAYE